MARELAKQWVQYYGPAPDIDEFDHQLSRQKRVFVEHARRRYESEGAFSLPGRRKKGRSGS